MRTPDPSLTPEQVAEAERIYQAFRDASEGERRRIAKLLAFKPDHEPLGRAEFQVRDCVHRIGAGPIAGSPSATEGPGWRIG